MANISEALNQVEITYKEITDIANEILEEILAPVNLLVDQIQEEGAGISAESIRAYMLKLQLASYSLSGIKDKSALKVDCAEALRKEKYARSYNSAEGTAGVKDNIALLASSEQLVVETLYKLVASLVKTKLDEVHRLIDTLKSNLMSLMQEAKLALNGID